MKKDNQAHNVNREKLRAENQEKINKLTEDYGAFYSKMSTDRELPPEIESLFLDNIMAFENAYDSAKQIQLYDFLGKPSYRMIEELSDEDILQELNRLNALLESHNIRLETICEVAYRELYRFMTEELFFEEIDDMRIPGMNTNFIYEEFHPNHKYDIFELSNNFIRSYLNKENEFYTYSLSTEAGKADWHLHFRQAFSNFQLNSFSVIGLNFDTEKAKVQFNCDFDGKVEGSTESLHFVGDGEFNLLYEWDCWGIDSIKLPKNQ